MRYQPMRCRVLFPWELLHPLGDEGSEGTVISLRLSCPPLRKRAWSENFIRCLCFVVDKTIGDKCVCLNVLYLLDLG